MKAEKIIEAMCYDSTLAEKSMVVEYDTWDGTYPAKEWCKEQFGAEPINAGKMKEGKFLVVYEVDGNDIYPFQFHNAPEITLRRINAEQYPEDDRFIWLWRIE